MNLSKPKINALLALALFTFAFLSAEFRFDINVGLLSGAERVVIAQGFILGASVLGFIGYAPLFGLAQRKGHSLAAVNAAAVPIVIMGLTQIQFPTAPLVLEILGCVAFFGLGLLGAAAHHAFSLAFQDDPKLATGAGAAYAAGILMQFAVNLLNCGGIAELIVLGTATIAISALSAVPQNTDTAANPAINPFVEPSHALAKQACWSIALVMILPACSRPSTTWSRSPTPTAPLPCRPGHASFWQRAALPPVLFLILPSAVTWDLSCSASPCSRPFPS